MVMDNNRGRQHHNIAMSPTSQRIPISDTHVALVIYTIGSVDGSIHKI